MFPETTSDAQRLLSEFGDGRRLCEFQRKAARYSDLIAATVPI